MAIELNQPALRHARALIREGKVVRDERDAWSEAAPTADEENSFIERNGWTDRDGVTSLSPRPAGRGVAGCPTSALGLVLG